MLNFEDTPIGMIVKARIREMTDGFDQIPSPSNSMSNFNGITSPVLGVLVMNLHQALRDSIIPAVADI